MIGFELPAELALMIFVVLCWCGFRYRTLWKTEGARWKLWLYGGLAGACFLALGFIPISTSF